MTSGSDDHSFDALRDAILRGVAHALSNRVAALGGMAGLVDPGEIWTERMSKALQDEARRLGDVLRLFRLLPAEVRVESGAIELQPLIPDIVALHAYHSALLQVECALEYNREAMPVYANRVQLVHALLLVIDAAKRHAKASGGRVVIGYSGDAERVTVQVATEPPVPSAAPGSFAAAAPNDGGAGVTGIVAGLRAAVARVGGNLPLDVFVDGDALRISLAVPTLAAGRRGEQAARAAER